MARPQRVSHERGAGFRLQERAGDHPAHAAPTEHAANAGDVIHMVMGEHEQRDLSDPLIVEAAVDRDRIRTRVDHHSRSRTSRQQQRVALPYVAGDEDLATGRPA